jgi:hypothetical protein
VKALANKVLIPSRWKMGALNVLIGKPKAFLKTGKRSSNGANAYGDFYYCKHL